MILVQSLLHTPSCRAQSIWFLLAKWTLWTGWFNRRVPEEATHADTDAPEAGMGYGPAYNHYQQGHYGMAGSPAFQKDRTMNAFLRFALVHSWIGTSSSRFDAAWLVFLLSFFGFGAILVFITSITNESGFWPLGRVADHLAVLHV
nr:hypothetical protein [Paenibacillus sp. IHB B 3084]